MSAQIIYSPSLDIDEDGRAINPVSGLGRIVCLGSFYVRGTMGNASYAIWERLAGGFYGLASWGSEIVDGELILSSYGPVEATGSSADLVVVELEIEMAR